MTTVTVVLAALLAAVPSRAAEAKSARLVHASGSVTIGGKAARPGAALPEGEPVDTGAGSTAVIELPDGSRLKLRASSRLSVATPKPGLTEARLTLGSVFAKVAKRLEGRSFHVRTPSAVAAVRGTEFFTAFGRGKGDAADLWVCVKEGAVELSTTKSAAGVMVPAGKGVLIKSGLDLTKPQAYDWTKGLNWNMDAAEGGVEDKTSLDGAYSDLLDQDYR